MPLHDTTPYESLVDRLPLRPHDPVQARIAVLEHAVESLRGSLAFLERECRQLRAELREYRERLLLLHDRLSVTTRTHYTPIDE